MNGLFISCSLYILLLTSACTKEEVATCTEVDYETAFIVESDKIYCFDDGSQIQIDSIGNALCPCDVDCIWGGEILIYLQAQEPDTDIVTPFVVHSERQRDLLESWLFEVTEYALEVPCGSGISSPAVTSATLIVERE